MTEHRETLATHLCENCRRATPELAYNDNCDEYWCYSCLDNEAEAAYERQQERDEFAR